MSRLAEYEKPQTRSWEVCRVIVNAQNDPASARAKATPRAPAAEGPGVSSSEDRDSDPWPGTALQRWCSRSQNALQNDNQPRRAHSSSAIERPKRVRPRFFSLRVNSAALRRLTLRRPAGPGDTLDPYASFLAPAASFRNTYRVSPSTCCRQRQHIAG
jgi:hypothetical protein